MKTTQPRLPLGREAVPTADPRLLTVREAANVLGMGRSTLYELIASGAVETVVIGRSRRVPHEALVSFVAALRAEPKP
jgi:excisionase family DNA binding protein